MKKEWRAQDLLDWTRNYFKTKGIEEPRLEAEVLLSYALRLERIELYVQFDRPANEAERALFRELIKRRVAGEPISYIVNRREFMSLPFYVDPRVLIPRPDTEILVEEGIRLLRQRPNQVRAADIGTGSGAIAVSLARYVPQVQVFAVDNNPGALEVATHNAALNGVEKRIVFRAGHLLEPLEGQQFHVIAANLPYIPSKDLPKLSKEVRDFEPWSALDGGLDGVSIYKELIPQAWSYLNEDGYLLVELGNEVQAQLLIDSLGSGWSGYYLLKDRNG